jgi:hypothetical protein
VRAVFIWLGILGSGLALAAPTKAKPKPKAKPATSPHIDGSVAEPTATPAYRYGQLTIDECEAELTTRGITFDREPSRGSKEPVRLTSALHGVEFHTELTETKRTTSPYEVADCRLVLALDDFAAILAAHDVVEVLHYSIYRPPGKTWPEDKIGIQHIGALAIDAAKFIKSDGKKLEVERDFHGSIGAKTCGKAAAPRPATPDSLELRSILCDAVDQHLFNVVLTPNHNRPHRNHFHLEVMADVKWFLVD